MSSAYIRAAVNQLGAGNLWAAKDKFLYSQANTIQAYLLDSPSLSNATGSYYNLWTSNNTFQGSTTFQGPLSITAVTTINGSLTIPAWSSWSALLASGSSNPDGSVATLKYGVSNLIYVYDATDSVTPTQSPLSVKPTAVGSGPGCWKIANYSFTPKIARYRSVITLGSNWTSPVLYQWSGGTFPVANLIAISSIGGFSNAQLSSGWSNFMKAGSAYEIEVELSWIANASTTTNGVSIYGTLVCSNGTNYNDNSSTTNLTLDLETVAAVNDIGASDTAKLRGLRGKFLFSANSSTDMFTFYVALASSSNASQVVALAGYPMCLTTTVRAI